MSYNTVLHMSSAALSGFPHINSTQSSFKKVCQVTSMSMEDCIEELRFRIKTDNYLFKFSDKEYDQMLDKILKYVEKS